MVIRAESQILFLGEEAHRVLNSSGVPHQLVPALTSCFVSTCLSRNTVLYRALWLLQSGYQDGR